MSDLGIPLVFDSVSKSLVDADVVLAVPDSDISRLRDQIQRERKANNTRYRCGLCRDPLYVSNSGGTSHFAHYIDSGNNCAWRSELPKSLDLISAERFVGRQEGELHQRLILTLIELCHRTDGFSKIGIPNQTLFGLPGTGHRFPDLAADYQGKRVVFELQISSTYLPVISDREYFYRRNGIYLIWLVHRFETTHSRQTERDILAVRSRQVFELDIDAIKASLETTHLHLKLHWQAISETDRKVVWKWQSRLVRFDELTFDNYLVEALAANPWEDEANLRREIYADTIGRFEKFWAGRSELASKLNKRIIEQAKARKPIDRSKSFEAVSHRAYEALLEASGADKQLAKRIKELKVEHLLDRLFFIRDGVNRFNGQTLSGAIDTVLENWGHFTDTIVAVTASHSYETELTKVAAQSKIARNLLGDGVNHPLPQCHEFDAPIALLFPKAAKWLRATSFAYCLKQAA